MHAKGIVVTIRDDFYALFFIMLLGFLSSFINFCLAVKRSVCLYYQSIKVNDNIFTVPIYL
jgi:hypothetical protein